MRWLAQCLALSSHFKIIIITVNVVTILILILISWVLICPICFTSSLFHIFHSHSFSSQSCVHGFQIYTGVALVFLVRFGPAFPSA